MGPPQGSLPYFPFLTELPRPDELAYSTSEEVEKSGRLVQACQSCTTSLMNQWTLFQRENVLVYSSHYTYPSLWTGLRSISSIRAHSPASQKRQEAGEAAAATALAAHQQIRTTLITPKSNFDCAGFAEAMFAFKFSTYGFVHANYAFFWLWLWGLGGLGLGGCLLGFPILLRFSLPCHLGACSSCLCYLLNGLRGSSSCCLSFSTSLLPLSPPIPFICIVL